MAKTELGRQRKAAGYRTQADLAAAVGYSTSAIGKIECGMNPKPGWWDSVMALSTDIAALKKKVRILQKLIQA